MTAALVFLVEAAAGTCALGDPARLSGGARVEQAVLEFEDEAADPFALTLTGSDRSDGAAPGETRETAGGETDPAPTPCKPVPMPIA